MSWIDGYIGLGFGDYHRQHQVGLTIITGPTSEPVTTTQLMAQCRIDATDDQTAMYPLYISAARAWCESYCRRTFPTQTLQMSLDRFPGDKGIIELRRPLIQSITSITYYDENDEQQTMSSADYYCDFDPVAPRLRPVKGQYWPGTSQNPISHILGGVKITYVAGYATVPNEVLAAILLVAADLYMNRASQVEAQLYKNPTAEALLSNYRTF